MGYLVCDKCGGYYELQEGESPDDFKNCQCGGGLKYVESLDEPLGEDLDKHFPNKEIIFENVERINSIIHYMHENPEICKESAMAVKEFLKNINIKIDASEALKKENISTGIPLGGHRVIFREVALIKDLYILDYVKDREKFDLDKISEVIANSLFNGDGMRDILKELKFKFPNMDNEEAESIARTETIRIKNLGDWFISNEKGYQYFIVIMAPDACDKCQKTYNNIFSIEEVDILPPLHNKCKCSANFFRTKELAQGMFEKLKKRMLESSKKI